ncbi:Protein png1 [Gnomoniopsis smithogilvyi]|uniref:Protein png1 n=1 Tax=Gnomoniopsis smithogilvyi TaxID=1191159 RepID=A0A9W8YMV5_9PEZI|nr:Protein png1 [Gnomoniopsis smithogilvyi]
MSMTETLPAPALAPQQQSRIGWPSLFQRRSEQSSSSTWPNPQLSIGLFIDTVGRDSIWEAIGPARNAFEILAPAIKAYLEVSTEPISCWITWSVYMLGRAVNTACPTILFCGENLKHRQDIRKAVKNSGLLSRYPGFKTGHMAMPPDFDQLVRLAHGTLPVNVKDITVSAKLSERACGTQIFINGSTPSGLQYHKRATVGGVIQVHDRFYYLTAGHPFAAEFDEDSDAFSFDGSDNDDSKCSKVSDNIDTKYENPHSSTHMSSARRSRDLSSLQHISARDRHDSRPLPPSTGSDMLSQFRIPAHLEPLRLPIRNPSLNGLGIVPPGDGGSNLSKYITPIKTALPGTTIESGGPTEATL